MKNKTQLEMDLKELLEKYRNKVIDEWIYRLHTEVSERYSARPLDELFQTVSKAADANYYALVYNDKRKINEHINWIAKLRLEGGFSLSEVQTAYELYRLIIMPYLNTELDEKDYVETLNKLNQNLFYTITRFSDYFQALHEKSLYIYAKKLEKEVENRTKRLQESEREYCFLLNEMNDGYFVAVKGVIVFANKAFAQMHGYDVDEVKGKNFLEFIGSGDSLKEKFKLIFQNDLQKEEIFVYLRKHKKGALYPTEIKIKPIVYRHQKGIGGILRDITERVELEKRMREAERFVHLGRIATCLAHEIRNPLSSVKMNVQIFARHVSLKGYDKRRLEIVLKEIDRLEKLLSDVLDFAKPLSLNLGKTNLKDILMQCIENLKPQIEEKQIIMKLKYSKRIPSLRLDEEKIKQAFYNILLNAIQAIDKGGRVEITGTMKKQNVIFSIIDNGCGIKKSDMPFIFDPFFSTKPKGTGLGLPLAKKIIEAHGGAINIKAKRPKGTCVEVIIPVKE